MSRMAQGCTQPPIPHVPRLLSPRVKLSWHEGDCSLPSTAKVKNEWSHTSTLPFLPSWCGGEHLTFYEKLHLSTVLTLLTYSMEHSPSWEANRFSASQEIPLILKNKKVHYCIHKCPPSVVILSQLDPIPKPTSHLLKIHPNIFLPSMLGSPKWSFSLRFPHQNPVYTSPLPHKCYTPCPSHSSWFYHPNKIRWAVQIIKLSLCSFLHFPVTSSLLGPNILLSTLFSNTLSVWSFLNVSVQVSHPYKITGKIIVLYILIFKFLNSKHSVKYTELKK